MFHGIVTWEDAYFESDFQGTLEEIDEDSKPFLTESVGWVWDRGDKYPMVIAQSRTQHGTRFEYADILRIPYGNVKSVNRTQKTELSLVK